MSAAGTGVPLLFGEVLFDCFEDGSRVLGGAPFNVSWHLQAFGAAPCFVSRVGDDDSGRAIVDAMRRWGMSLDGLQRDRRHATGQVLVRIADGEPHYEIASDRSWDHIDPRALPQVDAALVYHGTLALRSETSARALTALRDAHPGPVFIDVNLRPPFWQRQAVLDLVHRASTVKLSAGELDALAPGRGPLDARIRAFRATHGLRWLVVTRGAQGALAVDADDAICQVQPALATTVVDTVGAGDAFASVLILGALWDWTLPLTMQRAQDFASQWVGVRGATSDDPTLYRALTAAWGLSPQERG